MYLEKNNKEIAFIDEASLKARSEQAILMVKARK